MNTCPGQSLTFIEMTFQLIEVALLQTNLQMDNMVPAGALQFGPVAGNMVRLLDRVRAARFDRVREGSLSSEYCREQDSSNPSHGEQGLNTNDEEENEGGRAAESTTI